MLNKTSETRWLILTTIFLLLYCGYLFFFRSVLLKLDTANGTILKPEPGQIFAIGFFVLVYHLTYVGLYAFSALGKTQKGCAALLCLLIVLVLLYGFKLWFDAIANNPFLSFGIAQNLPWYAEEKNKFLLANGPLLLFIIAVFILRFIAIQKRSFTREAEAIVV